MIVTKRASLILFALCAAFTVLGLAQEEESQKQDLNPPQGWETKLYQISHQNVHAMRQLLDGFIGRYDPSASAHFNTMTLTAPPDVHAAVRALISEYDQPPRGINIEFYLLKGRRKENGTPPSLPEDISGIIGEVASLTAFKSFELMASPQVRTQEGNGISISGGNQPYHEIQIKSLRLQKDGRLQVHGFQIQVGGRQRTAVSMTTSFEIADGETVVLGTTELEGGGGDALVTLVTVRLID